MICVGKQDWFLAYHVQWKLCLEPRLDMRNLRLTNCYYGNRAQQWMWTKHGQLLNVKTRKCLQTSGVIIFLYNRPHPKVVLAHCKAVDVRQNWQCQGKNGLFYLKYHDAYLNYDKSRHYVIVFKGTELGGLWTRYGSNESLCSSVSRNKGKLEVSS